MHRTYTSGEGHTAIKDVSVGFGVDRQRLNVVCTEAPGVVVLTDPAMDDEYEMDELLDVHYGAGTLTENERIHYGDLKDRYRQRRDRTRQLVAQLSTLNTRQTLNPTEIRLLARTLTKEDIRKFSKFETLAAAICDQQDVIEGLHQRYDDQVASSSAQLAQLTRSHETKMAQELGQAKEQVDVANDRVASEAQAQLLLQEQEEQRLAVLISELRKALKAITDQDGANTRPSAAMEVLLRKELFWRQSIVLPNLNQHGKRSSSDITTKKRLTIWSSVVERQWRRSLLNGGVDAKEMRAAVLSFEE